MVRIPSINILGVNVNKLTNETFLHFIKKSIAENSSAVIAYANADTLNKVVSDPQLGSDYNSFDLIHPDGVGVYMASRFLYGERGLKKRLTGSDFYEILIKQSVQNGWKYFFFGHTDEILAGIRIKNPGLIISGVNEGYNYENAKVVEKINAAAPDVLIVGLSCPLQEKWMHENWEQINFKVMMAVGDGIKVFAGKKLRGPVFMRKLGLEWMVRLITNPVSNFRKYVIGIPLFIFRVIGQKIKM